MAEAMLERIGNYVLGELLGAGGMGRVFAAQHPTLNAIVVKLMHAALATEPMFACRLQEEARAGERVTHPNVVRVLDHGTTPCGTPYIVMKRASGCLLGDILEHGPLPLARIRVIATQILDGLAAIHRAGLVHGDLKSDNILVDEHDHVTIIDFGLARTPDVHPTWIDEHVLSGTPEYMAPELVHGAPASVASDLYAVGVILYEMLTGTTPFAGGTALQIFHRQVMDPVIPPSLRCEDRAIPPALERIVMRALSKTPAERPRRADLMSAAVQRAIPPGCKDTLAPTSSSAERYATQRVTRVVGGRR